LEDELLLFSPQKVGEFVALDEALVRLGEVSRRQSQIVELRFFGGLTVEETAEVLGVAPKTVKRDWSVARAWLYREIDRAKNGSQTTPGVRTV
jgi:DNA-directed RNA polymerase specialized sigma24 family protein